MSAHITDDIPRMLTGEAGRETVLAGAAHLRSCIDCQHELISAVVAHASLTSAQRFAPELVAAVSDEVLAREAEEHPRPAGAPDLPDLSAVFAQVRREAAGGAPDDEPAPGGASVPASVPAPAEASAGAAAPAHRHRQHRQHRRALLAAAAAVVVAGSGGTAAYLATSDDHTGGGRAVALAAFDTGRTPASATVSDSGVLRIDASALPQVAGKRYEVWLTNAARTRLQPIGWLSASGTAQVDVPPDLLGRYSNLEVSVQDVAARDYSYSGTSVLRGKL